jgi:hypothetical protein
MLSKAPKDWCTKLFLDLSKTPLRSKRSSCEDMIGHYIGYGANTLTDSVLEPFAIAGVHR